MKKYKYLYACTDEERALCELEMRSFFGFRTKTKELESSIDIDPSRSPFMKGKIEVIFKTETLEHLLEKLHNYTILDSFKVTLISDSKQFTFDERREVEKKAGLAINGIANLQSPDKRLAIMYDQHHFVFGPYVESEPVWFTHQQKPHHYSTALSTRVARAVVNIAVPKIENVKVIDPCCGIGTVLIEALSMGIDITGSDYNPLVMKGLRENILHFGYEPKVQLCEIGEIRAQVDVAIIDMPYNLCSVLSADEKVHIISSAKKIAKKIVFVTIEPLDEVLEQVGLTIIDRCTVKKGKTFTREVIICEHSKIE